MSENFYYKLLRLFARALDVKIYKEQVNLCQVKHKHDQTTGNELMRCQNKSKITHFHFLFNIFAT